MSYQLGSFFDKTDRSEKPQARPPAAETEELTTGSITPRQKSSATPAETDLAYARAVAADMLARGAAKDTSAPWENPRTGARGNITPLATAYTADGNTCRDFLASYVLDRAETWLQGEACKFSSGKWEVRSLKPWKRTS